MSAGQITLDALCVLAGLALGWWWEKRQERDEHNTAPSVARSDDLCICGHRSNAHNSWGCVVYMGVKDGNTLTCACQHFVGQPLKGELQ